MFDRSLQCLSTAARRNPARYVVALLACVLLALSWRGPAGHVDAAMMLSQPHGGAASVSADARSDLLRNRAPQQKKRSGRN